MTTPPWVVGTTRPEGLRALAAAAGSARERLPDLVEARLDLGASSGPLGEPDLTSSLPLCRRVESTGTPVLATIRLVADGGHWIGDTERLPWFERACAVASWLDIELESAIARQVVAAAHAGGRRVIVSHHDFRGTPPLPALEELARQGKSLGGDIVKIAAMVNRIEDHAVLIEFAHRVRNADVGVAIIGMGPIGTPLRSYLPCIGSRLTYGFLDEVAAPGQIPAGDLVQRLMADCPDYASAHRARR